MHTRLTENRDNRITSSFYYLNAVSPFKLSSHFCCWEGLGRMRLVVVETNLVTVRGIRRRDCSPPACALVSATEKDVECGGDDAALF